MSFLSRCHKKKEAEFKPRLMIQKVARCSSPEGTCQLLIPVHYCARRSNWVRPVLSLRLRQSSMVHVPPGTLLCFKKTQKVNTHIPPPFSRLYGLESGIQPRKKGRIKAPSLSDCTSPLFDQVAISARCTTSHEWNICHPGTTVKNSDAIRRVWV